MRNSEYSKKFKKNHWRHYSANRLTVRHYTGECFLSSFKLYKPYWKTRYVIQRAKKVK